MLNNEDEIGALWEKHSHKGDYMTGTVNGQRVVVFKNSNKGSDKSPDWRVLVAKPREESASGMPLDPKDVPF